MKDHTYFSVCNTLAAHFDVGPSHVKPEQHLYRDWGVDPLELNVIALRIEVQEDIEIRARELEAVSTVGQLISLVRAIRRRDELADEITAVRRRNPRHLTREKSPDRADSDTDEASGW